MTPEFIAGLYIGYMVGLGIGLLAGGLGVHWVWRKWARDIERSRT